MFVRGIHSSVVKHLLCMQSVLDSVAVGFPAKAYNPGELLLVNVVIIELGVLRTGAGVKQLLLSRPFFQKLFPQLSGGVIEQAYLNITMLFIN